MKMAKASTADMDMALKLCSALEAIDRRFFPDGAEGDNDPEEFYRNDDAHCGQALRHVLDILQGGSIGRVIWGMYVMLDPDNKVVDPDADTLEDHPETVAAMNDAERYRKLRRGQHWSVIDGIGDTLRAEALDAAVDAVPALPANVKWMAFSPCILETCHPSLAALQAKMAGQSGFLDWRPSAFRGWMAVKYGAVPGYAALAPCIPDSRRLCW